MTKCRAFDRIYDCEGFWLRAACVCVRDDSESEVSAKLSCKLFF
jgi:hypothetical protein